MFDLHTGQGSSQRDASAHRWKAGQGGIIGRVFTGLFSAFVNVILVRRLIGVTVLKQLSANIRALRSIAVMAAGVRSRPGVCPTRPRK
ncbi:hypothetical protein [Mesorhizobium carmichaelinearum]|uniref:hypothetical protein n=1 Tax=Mesorhizobium carmichaelinearum TaxID=1208188 RepID=UPI0015CE52F2|nr:hypothetical protein [Mesorhizobium carmichaelinearum]